MSLVNLSLSSAVNLSPLHEVLIYSTHFLPQLRQFWDIFRVELGDEGPYQVSISAMRLRFSELKESDNEAWKIRAKGLKDVYEEIDGVLHH